MGSLLTDRLDYFRGEESLQHLYNKRLKHPHPQNTTFLQQIKVHLLTSCLLPSPKRAVSTLRAQCPHHYVDYQPQSILYDTYEALLPHIEWTCFLSLHFQKFMKSFSRDHIRLIAQMLYKSFAKPELLNSKSISFPARMRLLLLGLTIVQNSSLKYHDKQLLRDRVYQTTLHWFYGKPVWYDPDSPLILQEEVDVVIELSKPFQTEEKYYREIKEVEKQVVKLTCSGLAKERNYTDNNRTS